MTRVAVVLSGCGYLDGAEIRESVITLLALDRAGAKVTIFAPDINQTDVVNHLTVEPSSDTRNVLIESARIARGNVTPLEQADAAEFDALVIPGGFGVAKNLSNFASEGISATVYPPFAAFIRAFADAGKPIGAICIAPAIIALVLGKSHQPRLTIGDDSGTAQAIESLGASHVNCASEQCVIDEVNRIVTCSAYMRDDALGKIADGIEATITQVMKMAKTTALKKSA